MRSISAWGRAARLVPGALLTLACMGGRVIGQDTVSAETPKAAVGQKSAATKADAAKKPEAPKPVDPMQIVAQQLESADAAVVDAGVAAVREAFKQKPGQAASWFQGKWAVNLEKGKRYAELEEFAAKTLLIDSTKAGAVESVQRLRVKALLETGKPQEALAQAKALYNVATMKGTAAAVKLLAQCLAAANPGNRAAVDTFKQEQIEGAKVEAGNLKLGIGNSGGAASSQGKGTMPLGGGQTPAPAEVVRSSVLDGIKVEGKVYEERIRALVAEDYKTLAARGNLLLLADRPAEAKEDFERAYALSEDKDLSEATENLARCMKAQDGTVGRANAWVLSLRPKAPATPATPAPVTAAAPTAEAKK